MKTHDKGVLILGVPYSAPDAERRHQVAAGTIGRLVLTQSFFIDGMYWRGKIWRGKK